MDQIAASVNLDRLPSGMRSFLSKQYGIGPSEADTVLAHAGGKPSDVSDDRETGSNQAAKKQKIKHFPRPPSGPPPPSALAAGNST